MYPDWRFRPGSNALAKLKIKDGGTSTRRRSARVKDPPDDAADEESPDADQGEKGKGKGKGRNKSSARMHSLEEMRCAKIADFVADGIRGEELEVAVKRWEGDRKMRKEKTQRPRLSRTRGASSASTYNGSGSSDNYSPVVMEVSPTGTHSQDSISFPISSGTNTATTSFDPLTWQDRENRGRIEEIQEPNSWWADSRSAEVEPSTFNGYYGPSQRPSNNITEMGYENCSGTQFDAGYVEVRISFSLFIILFPLNFFFPSMDPLIRPMMQVRMLNGQICLIIPIDMDWSQFLIIHTRIVVAPLPLIPLRLQLYMHLLSPIATTTPNPLLFPPHHSQP